MVLRISTIPTDVRSIGVNDSFNLDAVRWFRDELPSAHPADKYSIFYGETHPVVEF